MIKGLILCGGKGTRLRPISFDRPKHLIPVANEPIIQYTIRKMVVAGITEIGIVTGPNPTSFSSLLGDGDQWNCRLTYIPQINALGLAHAVLTAQPFIAQDPFVLVLGDVMFEQSLEPGKTFFVQNNSEAHVLLYPVNQPERYGIAVMDGRRIVNLEEKPKEPRSNLALAGVYFFRSSIFEAINQISPSSRGELEITDAIGLLSQEQTVSGQEMIGWWKDIGFWQDVLKANQQVLADNKSSFIGQTVQLNRCQVIEPVVIGDEVSLNECIIGPYTSIGAGSRICNCQLANTVILEQAQLENLQLQSALVGAESKICHQECTSIPFLTGVIGSHSQVEISW